MSHLLIEKGGVVGQVLCSILAILGAVATYSVVRISIDRIRGGGDPGVPVFATRASDRSSVAGQVDRAAEVRRPEEAKATIVESNDERAVIDLPTPQGMAREG